MKLKEDENTTLESYFKEFYDWFYDYLVADGIDEDTIETLADKQLDGPWDVRTYFHEPHLLALNVKGKGAGDWDKYDLNGRASKFDADYDQYYNMLQGNIDSFFEGWAETFKEDYGVDLYAGGRSGGWWGFKIDDIDTDSDIFQMNKEKVRQLFDTKAPTLLLSEGEEDEDFDIQDFAYDLASEVDASEYISFTPSFVRDCNYFYSEIIQTSDEWESQDWNDEQFENDKEWNGWDDEELEDYNVKKPVKEVVISDRYRKELTALCNWAIRKLGGDKAALYFNEDSYNNGILIAGNLPDMYLSRSNADIKSGEAKANAFKEVVEDYTNETGVKFDYKIINTQDGRVSGIDIEVR
jgi:hypothetical protein